MMMSAQARRALQRRLGQAITRYAKAAGDLIGAHFGSVAWIAIPKRKELY
jgi:hypothetical protein